MHPHLRASLQALGPQQLKHCQIFVEHPRTQCKKGGRQIGCFIDLYIYIYMIIYVFFSRQYIITYISKCVIHLHTYTHMAHQQKKVFHQERLRLRMLPGHAKASVVPCCWWSNFKDRKKGWKSLGRPSFPKMQLIDFFCRLYWKFWGKVVLSTRVDWFAGWYGYLESEAVIVIIV